jgi:hypothetical protein
MRPNWLRWPRRRRREVVVVSADVLAQLRELAVLGAAYAVIEDAQLAWLNMDSSDFGPWRD